jgi:glycosyltransferase involved in cell wall biosynthesis
MKIIILGPAHPLRPGGITTFNERLCRAFNEAGHDCSIWSFSLQYPSFLFPGSSQFTDAPPPKAITIRTLINSINPMNWWKVGRMLQKERPDLVVVRFWIPFMGPCLGTILRIAKKNRHTKVVCIADNIIPHESRPGDNAFTLYFIKPVDGFVVMSQQVMNDLRTFTQKKAMLIPHPLYDNFGEKTTITEARDYLRQKKGLSLPEAAPLLVFFGLIRQYKGLDLLLEAMHSVENKSVHLLIAGEFYEDKQPYLDLIVKYQLSERVHLYDQFVSNEEVKYFICSGDCIIQPYRHATQSGVTPLAYHFEIPMIVTNVGGLPQMVPEHAGLHCNPDAPSIANTIDRFFVLGSGHFADGIKSEKQKLSWTVFTDSLLGLADTL